MRERERCYSSGKNHLTLQFLQLITSYSSVPVQSGGTHFHCLRRLVWRLGQWTFLGGASLIQVCVSVHHLILFLDKQKFMEEYHFNFQCLYFKNSKASPYINLHALVYTDSSFVLCVYQKGFLHVMLLPSAITFIRYLTSCCMTGIHSCYLLYLCKDLLICRSFRIK